MQSMTGFAAAQSEAAGRRWRWEAKSVNGRGLDLRLRVSDVAEADEADLRARAGKRLARGSITIFLREEGAGPGGALALNEPALRAALEAGRLGEALAAEQGLTLAPASIADYLAIRGVMEPSGQSQDDGAEKSIVAALGRGFDDLITGLIASRAEEGARLRATIAGQIDQIDALHAAAATVFAAQMEDAPARLAEKVASVLEAAEADPDRLAQELALLAVKADIRGRA